MYKNIFLIGLCLLLLSSATWGQVRKKAARDPFYGSQWWLGVRVGTTLTNATVIERYNLFSSTLGADQQFDKEYRSFIDPGVHAGAVIVFNFGDFGVAFQPTYNNMNLVYENTYFWQGAGSNSLLQENRHRVVLNYLELPLSFRYKYSLGSFTPFVQVGAFYGTLIKADKYIEIESFDAASGAGNAIDNTTPIIGAKPLFINSNWGVWGGLGVSYDAGNVRLGLEANYRYGINNVTNRRTRYTDNRMIGIGDALDDISLQNIEISFTCLFPMKFLQTGSFRSVKP